ncbi:hypothetical protein ACQR16_17660 [Bradyrhizobium oligotrophicum]|uniref:hypothetical protein n=1 Tax=Bradyrhizobium oligotrophicum TaxID=44255 RepID=UPI003EB869B8
MRSDKRFSTIRLLSAAERWTAERVLLGALAAVANQIQQTSLASQLTPPTQVKVKSTAERRLDAGLHSRMSP